MAVEFKKLDPRIWDDEDFRSLTTSQKLVCIYAFSGQSNRIGLFPFSPAKGAEQLDMSLRDFSNALEAVCAQLGWQHDKERRVLYIPTWWKYNHPMNASHFIGCLKDIHNVPRCGLIDAFLKNVSYLDLEYHSVIVNTCPQTCHTRVGGLAELSAAKANAGRVSSQDRRDAEAEAIRKARKR